MTKLDSLFNKMVDELKLEDSPHSAAGNLVADIINYFGCNQTFWVAFSTTLDDIRTDEMQTRFAKLSD